MLRKGRELLAAVCKIYFYCYCTHSYTHTHTEAHTYRSTTITTSSVRNGAGNATWPSRYPLTLAIRRADKKQQQQQHCEKNTSCFLSYFSQPRHTHTLAHTDGERHIHRVLMEAASALKKTEGRAGNSSCRRKRRSSGGEGDEQQKANRPRMLRMRLGTLHKNTFITTTTTMECALW